MVDSPAGRHAAAIACCLLAAVLALTLAACGSDSGDSGGSGSSGEGGAVPDGPIVIGAAVAESGDFAPYDEGPLRAVRAAISDVNAAGGVDGHRLELVVSDTTSDPAKGGESALDVISKGAKIVVLTCDFDNSSAAAQTAASKGVIAVSTCGGSDRFNPDVLGPLVFSMATRGVAEGENMAQWAYERMGWRRGFLVRDTNIAYAQDLCGGMDATFTRLGGEIAGQATFKGGDQRFTAQISDVRKADPDFVFVCAGAGEGTPFMKQLRAAGIDTPILAGAAFDGTYWQNAVPGLSDVYFATYGSLLGDDPRPAVNRFFADLERRDGKKSVTSFDLTGYALVEAFKRGVEKAGSVDGEALSRAYESFRDERLITGPQTFTASEHISGLRPMAIMEVQGGRLQFVELYPER
ncbi:ABC transporter substrate-binding protein [Conexibacter woesei]|uniref:Extracellular ligand-binding receptor n=1 Tax=Conexibacter woesei (strain DSM 14684 / CCUG 47730 / CIP 108061 / JCM 11494 / NBRC 100937 / ID131577) TaxID=469383 RepID=D3F6Z7_CONWI|nr:ABC transporter substrate-binding protein [Conexibacter woesei]ADB52795.1 Extracellular ligand-binding receptor [Conexibacter woesei DSM 14684]